MAEDFDFSFSSNLERLTPRHWLCVAVVTGLAIALIPLLAVQKLDLEVTDNYRIPHKMSNDYWLFSRWAAWAADRDVLLIGDSVIWGEYVAPDNTLSAFLNDMDPERTYANLGLEGAHPMALYTLLKHYGSSIRNTSVIVHFNPLWMRSKRTEFRDREGEARINHPQLLPQFNFDITRYDAPLQERLSVTLMHRLPALQVIRHWQVLHFDGVPVLNWTIQNPYSNPLRKFTTPAPTPHPGPASRPQHWREARLSKIDAPWIAPEDSLQWRAFMQILQLLRSRGNNVTVLLGPLNEHMLEDESLNQYRVVKAEIVGRLELENVPICVPPLLPCELYCDASHPVAEGYEKIAAALLKCLDSEKF